MTTQLREHVNYKRTPFSRFAVTAAGYESAAYFETERDAHSFAQWLHGLGYAPWVDAADTVVSHHV